MTISEAVLTAAIDAYSRELASVQSGVPNGVAHRAAMWEALEAAFNEQRHETYVAGLRCDEEMRQRLLVLTVKDVRKEMDPGTDSPYINALKTVRKLVSCDLSAAKVWVDAHREALTAKLEP
jgi:ribosomal protein L7/L12